MSGCQGDVSLLCRVEAPRACGAEDCTSQEEEKKVSESSPRNGIRSSLGPGDVACDASAAAQPCGNPEKGSVVAVMETACTSCGGPESSANARGHKANRISSTGGHVVREISSPPHAVDIQYAGH
eukprot:gene8133-biopygen6353